MRDVGKRNLGVYILPHSENRHCHKEGPIQELSELFDARELNNIMSDRTDSNQRAVNTRGRVHGRRTDVSFNAVFILAILPLLTCFVAKYDTTLRCCNRRGMGPSTVRIRALKRKFAKGG